MRNKGILYLLLMVLIFSCKTQPEGYFVTSNLPGMIYDSDNRPCNKVAITVYENNDEGEELEIAQIQSDINGRFTIPDLGIGTYRILSRKPGYETVDTTIFYSSRLDVLYLKIFSQYQILSKTIDALSEKRFGMVEDYLKRSENINSDDPYSLYIKSVYLYEKKSYSESIDSLKRIVEMGFDFPYVHLLLADIYQFKNNEPVLAIEELTKYLNQIEDSDIEIRKKELEKNAI
jgi:tetratricopeptide (TPR) repeat protein